MNPRLTLRGSTWLRNSDEHSSGHGDFWRSLSTSVEWVWTLRQSGRRGLRPGRYTMGFSAVSQLLPARQAATPAPRRRTIRPDIDDRFAKFDADNPDVFDLFKRFAEELLLAGKTRGSSRAILSRLVWEADIRTSTNEGYKINHDYSSRYARKLAVADARFVDFFEFRKLTVRPQKLVNA